MTERESVVTGGTRALNLRVGIDVGGTFTDFALYDEATGELDVGKVLTTSDDPSAGVLSGLDALADNAGRSIAALNRAIHATTIATNTVIQRKGPPTALMVTQGFRDILIIARQKRWELYDNSIDKPVPLIPRDRVWEVPGRLLYDGTVRTPLDEAAVRRATRAIVAAGVRALAITFMHSYANGVHERRAAEIVREEAPDLLVTLSSDVSPIYREYERANTTVLNAYVMPVVSAYIREIKRGLRDRGFGRELFIMQSNGGIATSEVIERLPVRVIESGPAAGVLTAVRFAAAAGTDNLLSFDMGGTTAKLCLIENGQPGLTGQFEVDMVQLKKNSGLPVNIPAIDLVEIGAGGGSIASVRMGAIVVGPESAGSDPGPICYGRGGAKSTVTDADLVLGYLNPDYFLGGRMPLDANGARSGIEAQLANPLGIDTVAAAWGVYEVANSQMAHAARIVSVGRGKDPRHFAFIPFGGAGPVHGARLARMLGCRRVVFPMGAGAMSAIGLLMAEAAFDLARTQIMTIDESNLATFNALYRELEAQAQLDLEACGADGARVFRRSADMRFAGQGYEINVPLPTVDYQPGDATGLKDAFFEVYTRTYGDREFDHNDLVEGVNWRLSASGGRPPFEFAQLENRIGMTGDAAKGNRPVYFPETDGFSDCPVYDRYALRAEDALSGPAIVEERESTVVIPPESHAFVDPSGNIIVDLDYSGASS